MFAGFRVQSLVGPIKLLNVIIIILSIIFRAIFAFG